MTRLALALLGLFALYEVTSAVEIVGDKNRVIILEFEADGASLSIRHKDKVVLKGKIGYGRDAKADYAEDKGILKVTPISHGFKVKWESKQIDTVFKDCIEFQNDVHWYGGPQRRLQVYPVQNMTIDSSEAYVIKKDDNFGVAEYYWLNSNGVYIHVNERTPLFVDQNVKEPGKICYIAQAKEPFVNRTRVLLEYDIILEDNAREAHLHAVKHVLGKPKGHPHPGMVKEPIWTTWAKYKWNISDAAVLEFARGIKDHGYAGQLEIDDAWEKCYGAQEFDLSPNKFADIENTVKELKKMGFRVTLWVHPFVNDDCQPNSDEGKQKGYFVKDASGRNNATWWDSSNSHQIDFTNPAAAKWYSARLKKLQKNPGIDAFKFDAGESNYGPQPSVYDHLDPELIPNALTKHYVETCAKFGDLIEVRSAWRTQTLPIFVRMLDKDSDWGHENGLYTLVTTLFQLNLNGYPMVLPDMIGGNAYGDQRPDAEMIIRWTQANTFMPAMQFSFLPWEFKSDKFDTEAIVKKYVDLHAEKSDIILEAMEEAVKSGNPVNPPIWWIAPEDPIAQAVDTEYLVGEKILVAPILEQGATSRSVYLPAGTWIDGNNGTTYQGPLTIDSYPAPIDVLPWFTKKAKV